MPRSSTLTASAGLARVVAETPTSDGTVALDIVGFRVRDSGVLDSTFRLMPLIPDAWRGGNQPAPFTRGVFGLHSFTVRSTIPELLVLTEGASVTGGVWRFAPWGRGDGGTEPGLEEIIQLGEDGATFQAPTPSGTRRHMPSYATLGDRVYFTFGDDGIVWVWERRDAYTRAAGYTGVPGPPTGQGTMRVSATDPNGGGFSAAGRVGNTEAIWTDSTGTAVGGLDSFHRAYACVWENTAGAYSATSPQGGDVFLQFQLADPSTVEGQLENLLRRFRVSGFPKGMPGTAALILLATPNLRRLPPGDLGALRFHTRFPSNEATGCIDDLPDGELGRVWRHRMAFPTAVTAVSTFAGSLWAFSGSRAYWSEQEESGPVAESVMDGHWFDVYPATGDVTAVHLFRGLGGDSAPPYQLVFKPGACHYIAGTYPTWARGTLHPQAGCYGTQLVQTCPDGSVVWVGNGTAWRAAPDSPIPVDIGGPIRKRLRRVNHRARYGVSWVDQVAGEVVFALPLDDDELNSWQFVWDYLAGGWRFRHDVAIRAATVVGGVVILAGEYDGVDTVWAYGRGYPNYNVSFPTALYQSGWRAYGDGPDIHAATATSQLAVVIEERCDNLATVRVYSDWNTDDVVDSDESILLRHAENDVYCYGGGVTDPTFLATYDGAARWRSRRFAATAVAVSSGDTSVLSIAITSDRPMGLVAIDMFGELKAPAPGELPRSGP